MGVEHAGVVCKVVHPMFFSETPVTLALPTPFLDPDSLQTHEPSPSPFLLFRPWQLGAEGAPALMKCWAEVQVGAQRSREHGREYHSLTLAQHSSFSRQEASVGAFLYH